MRPLRDEGLVRAATRLFCGGLLALVAGGCRPTTPASADREVASILHARHCAVPEAGPIDLQHSECAAETARASVEGRVVRHIRLAEALDLATRASREIREQREEVYLAALALSDARHDFAAIPFAGATGEVVAEDGGGSASAAPTAGFTRALQTGGTLAVAVLGDFLRNLAGTPVTTAQNLLSLDLLVPLLRGSGTLVARENLTQAERDVIYALRSYVRFQQQFTVRIATSFYRVLEARDTWRNEQRTYESLLRLEARSRAMGPDGAGRIPNYQVAQARQDTLRADDRRQRAESTYLTTLDALRVLLGLPPGAAIEPGDEDLAVLAGAPPRSSPLTPEQAEARARDRRLDLFNAREQVDDARRKAEVARDGLRGTVDLALGADLTTPSTQPLNLRDASKRLSVGLVVDLPLDRLPERNVFRAALIQAVRAWRALEGLEDELDRQLRADLRVLAESARSREILTEGVRLAEQRVEFTTLDFEGPSSRVAVRDILEAEDDLVQARNDLTAAMVDHAIAWMQLDLDLGTLRVDGERGDAPCLPPCPPRPPPPRPPPPRPCSGDPCPPRPRASEQLPPPPAAVVPGPAK